MRATGSQPTPRGALLAPLVMALLGCLAPVVHADDQDVLDALGRFERGGRVITAWDRARQQLSPEASHYLGRATAAHLVERHGLVDAPEALAYLDRVGQSLVWSSPEPETWGGYRFLLLDSEQSNAYACPGGLVLLTRGLVARLESEDELAAVLAHELVHVQQQHGEQQIEEKRWQKFSSAAAKAVRAAAFPAGPLVPVLEKLTGDAAELLVERGHGRIQERRADLGALELLERAGYDPRALDRVLAKLRRSGKGKGSYRRTHPEIAKRRQALAEALGERPELEIPAIRVQRFRRALAAVLTTDP